MSWLTQDDVVRYLQNLGLLDVNGRVAGVLGGLFNEAAATQAVTAAMGGQTFRAAVDAVFTLPAAGVATRGVTYRFQTGVVSAGTGLSISPAAADAIFGAGLTAVVNKDLINTGATDVLGDFVTIRGTGAGGVTAWEIVDLRGIWAKEA